MTTPKENPNKRSVEEIVEEILDYNQKFGCGLMAKKRITETLQAERQKQEDMVEAERSAIERKIEEVIDKHYTYENAIDEQVRVNKILNKIIKALQCK